MTKCFYIFIVLNFLSVSVFSQGMRDSIFEIGAVKITANSSFQKELAGMKQTRVDTFVLAEKINLNLSDVLAENTGVYIKNYGRGALATASFRGTAPTHTQVSWNGININSPMLGMVDFSLIPVYIIDELNLQHGAASVKKQSGGLGGHIDIQNTVNWNNTFSARFYQTIGSFSTFDEFGQINIGNKIIQSKTRIYHNYSKNDYEFLNKHVTINDNSGNKIAYPYQKQKNASYSKYGISQELFYRASNHLISSAKFWYQDAKRSIPSVMSYEGADTATSRENKQFDNTFKAVADAKYYMGNLKATVLSGLDYQQLDYTTSIKVSGAELNKPVNSGSDMYSWYNKAKFDYLFSENISFAFSTKMNYFDISTLDSANHTGYDKQRAEYSAFSGIYISFSKQLNASFEIRKDWIPAIHTPLIYNLGLSYKPFTGQDFIVKSSFVRNFHNPSLNDLYWQPGGNPDLLPEQGHTLETGLDYLLSTKKSKFEVRFTAYYSKINNWILWLPSVKGFWEPVNVKKVLSSGLEAQLKYLYQWKKTSLKLQGNYTYARSVNHGDAFNENDGSVGEQLPFIPLHSGNALLALTHNGYYINYQYQNYGMRNLLSSNGNAPGDSDFPFYQLYAHHLNHISVGKNIYFDDFNLGAEVKIHNLFNEVYRNVLNRFMPRRNYTFLLKLSF